MDMHRVFCGSADSYSDAALLTSLWGTLLPSGTGKEEQCYVCFIAKGEVGDTPLELEIGDTTSRLIILLEEAATATLHVHLDPQKADALHFTEIFIRTGATLHLLFFQNSASSSLTVKQRSSLDSDARLHVQNISLGSGTLTHTLLSDINGARSESTVDWLFYSRNTEKQRIDARNAFHAREGRGEITMKGVAEGEAHSVCTGMIDIDPGGGGTDTYLTEDVLMLDKTAKVDAIPGLEIKTNDVKASHSATVSKVTSEDLFYFAARGIATKEAREMYVLGFLGDLTQRILDVAKREVVMGEIERKYRN
ncbi:hypothetical protein COU76_04890 [Candidatus Peregrinibacteria bacterium CG10_big_fil_rev_8_21_14_0_10_49_10]|nr:MAG: hypothetical protein COU76_04890 [Candidatus Peregrinibacteria bacterium CG10_big_fil_rev_8_21_14_0_10_49_10]